VRLVTGLVAQTQAERVCGVSAGIKAGRDARGRSRQEWEGQRVGSAASWQLLGAHKFELKITHYVFVAELVQHRNGGGQWPARGAHHGRHEKHEAQFSCVAGRY
jgi:hypothetical protein